MKKIFLLFFVLGVMSLIFFTSCSNIVGQKMLLNFLPDEIDSFSNFMWAWLVVTICQFVVVLIISLIFSCRAELPNIVVGIVYFIVILKNMDYGFWMTVLLFITTIIIGLLFVLIFSGIRRLMNREK